MIVHPMAMGPNGLAATLDHAHRWRHLTQLNLCRPYLRNPFADYTAARTDGSTPDGHGPQWFWLRYS
jgi:hypothetical protein